MTKSSFLLLCAFVVGIVGIVVIAIGSNQNPTPDKRPKPVVQIGGKATISSDALACRDLKDWQTLVGLANDKDEVAFNRLWQDKAMTGDCAVLRAGTHVFVKDFGFMTGTFCVRPEGEIECLWMTQSRVGPNESIRDQVNDAFNKQHPECKDWQTRKDLPDYCY
jgi:hypothetical protein